MNITLFLFFNNFFLVRDLLGDNPIAKLDVKLNPEGGLHVPGLTEIEVESANDINEVS